MINKKALIYAVTATLIIVLQFYLFTFHPYAGLSLFSVWFLLITAYGFYHYFNDYLD